MQIQNINIDIEYSNFIFWYVVYLFFVYDSLLVCRASYVLGADGVKVVLNRVGRGSQYKPRTAFDVHGPSHHRDSRNLSKYT
jgi:hypothetical protein